MCIILISADMTVVEMAYIKLTWRRPHECFVRKYTHSLVQFLRKRFKNCLVFIAFPEKRWLNDVSFLSFFIINNYPLKLYNVSFYIWLIRTFSALSNTAISFVSYLKGTLIFRYFAFKNDLFRLVNDTNRP